MTKLEKRVARLERLMGIGPHICPKRDDCRDGDCSHREPHDKNSGCTTPCGDDGVLCRPTAGTEE